jgi:hypothetical protein
VEDGHHPSDTVFNFSDEEQMEAETPSLFVQPTIPEDMYSEVESYIIHRYKGSYVDKADVVAHDTRHAILKAELVICNEIIQSVIDTGSALTLGNLDLLSQLRHYGKLLPPQKNLFIVSASGHRVKPAGLIKVPIKVGGRVVQQNAAVGGLR